MLSEQSLFQENLSPAAQELLKERNSYLTLLNLSCPECQNGKKYRCTHCESDPGFRACADHMLQHATIFHRETENTQQRVNARLRDAMANHGLASFCTREYEFTRSAILPNNTRSNWFDEADFLGLNYPAIMTWFLPGMDESTEQKHQEMSECIDSFLNLLNYRIYKATANSRLTLFVAEYTEIPYLPQFPNPKHRQESVSGLVFNPEADPGKIAKRLRVATRSQGAWFTPEPSWWPNLKLGSLNLTLKSNQSERNAGDGSGFIRYSTGMKMIRAAQAETGGDIIAIQPVFLGADYAGKGLFPLIPDHQFPYPDVDMVIDRESINHQVLSTKFTIGKLMPKRHKPNKRYVYLEPLNHSELLHRFISYEEIAEQAQVIAERADLEAWRKALQEDLTDELEQNRIEHRTNDDWEDSNQRITFTDEDFGRIIAEYKSSGQSPFANPSVTGTAAGGISKNWQSRLRKSTTKAKIRNLQQPDGKTVRTNVPGIMVSGEKVWLAYPPYWNATFPEHNYARLIWHFNKPDELVAIGFHPDDMAIHLYELDTADGDDQLTLVFLRSPEGHPQVLIRRMPASIDDGFVLKLDPADAAKLQTVGYHFYQQTGSHKFPGLHRMQDDGAPQYPDVLKAREFEEPIQWTNDENLVVTRLLEMTKNSGILGQVCNLVANLDYAGLYDPAKHKFNTSDAVIDSALNASKDPTPIAEALEQEILDAIQAGKPMDPCVFGRSIRSIEKRHRSQTNDPFAGIRPRLRCQEHHQPTRQAMNEAIATLQQNLKRRQLLANGPLNRILEPPCQELVDLIAPAFERRKNLWSQAKKDENSIRKDPDLTLDQRKFKLDQLTQRVREKEKSIMLDAYNLAQEVLPGLKPGDIIALWNQLGMSDIKRFSPRDGKTLNEIKMYATHWLPWTEVEPYYRSGPSLPTALLRTATPVELEPGTECFVAHARDGVRKDRYYLVDAESRKRIAELKGDASNYQPVELRRKPSGAWYKPTGPIKLLLKIQGPMPRIESSKPNPDWEQAENLWVATVCNPEQA